MRICAVAGLVLACGACAKPAQPKTIHDQRQAVLDYIADRCGIARSTFKLVGDNELHVQPSPDVENYEGFDCALEELKRAKLPVKMGFVGNEYYVGNEQ